MHTYWKKKTEEEIKSIVFSALDRNVNYDKQNIIGIPASFLDDKVFNQDASFLRDAPFISSLIKNPNHIGCHTLGNSESFFSGTQDVEKELIEICAVDILKGEPLQQDGYIASGGTEANIQAIWIYRNLFINKFSALREEICILCSEDSHYSMDKAANLLAIDIHKVPIDSESREVESEGIRSSIQNAQNQGKKYFIVICNMMTTMFGSVDHVDRYTDQLIDLSCNFKLHVDGAYGGFYYPFTNDNSQLTFKNQNITSFTLDAHKMAQAPYGTGVFLIRKEYIQHVNTRADYVQGEDFTLIGSRSGANAIAVWMILVKNGPFGWQEKVFILQKRTAWMSDQLSQLGVDYYRHSKSNIITIKSQFINQETVEKFGLVPDNHHDPKWFKIVIMEHVTIEKLLLLIEDIKTNL
jgi:tyrosine decarboxylase/aspartate 1-decarboxylase